jgi:hypothetical protein
VQKQLHTQFLGICPLRGQIPKNWVKNSAEALIVNFDLREKRCMDYSLFNRFRGVYLGAALGELLGMAVQQKIGQETLGQSAPFTWYDIDDWGLQSNPANCRYLRDAIAQTQSILTQTLVVEPPHSIALIPLILVQADVATDIDFSVALLQAMCRNQFKIQNSKFKIWDSGGKVQNSKFKIQNSKFGIEGLGFDVPMGGFRAVLIQGLQQQAVDLPLAGAIAGAIGGATHSLSGIPLSWRNALPDALRAELLELSDRLYAMWAGVHQSSHLTDPGLQLPLTTYPRPL